jgi:Calx-beta domain/Cysteine-rich secretory protein family
MRSAPRTSCRRRLDHPEPLERRALLDGSVPPGMDLAQANWFYQNTFAAPASVAPEWNGNVATGEAGSLGAAYLAAIIARVNDYRWMAGLPGGVTLDPTEDAEAQQAALIMAANVELSHSPSPDWLDYTTAGADAAAHSDLDLGVSGVAAIDVYMTDPGSSNTFVGHRRWVLYPPTQTMGVGDIPAQSNALYVVQPQATPAPSVTAVAWPPAGFVPAPLMPQRWSLQSDANADFSNATVTVTQNGTPQTVEILSDDADDYGGNAITWDLPFAPAPQPRQQVVDAVSVNNVLINGAPQSFSYTTTSFDPSATTLLEPVPAQVEFLQPTAQVSSSSGSIVIEVARSMNAGQEVSVDYAITSGTARAGTNYVGTSGSLTFAPGQFYSQIVVPILAGNSQSPGGTFSIGLYLPTGASIGPVSAVQVTIVGAPSVYSPPQAGAGGPITEPIVENNPPTVLGALEVFQTTVVGHTRQSRRSETKLVGFELTFNEQLDGGSATARSNYAVLEYQLHGRKLVSQSIPLRASYDPNADTVTLVLIGQHPFPQGGHLVLKTSRPYGITNPSGAPLVGNTAFTILPRANGITP